MGKHQETNRWAQLVCNTYGGDPTYKIFIFLKTLVISGSVPIQASKCKLWELFIIGG